MDKQKQEYLEQIMHHFMRYSIKSVTMDDISKQLKMSKKTLYKYFKDKDEIVCTIVKMQIAEENEIMQAVCQKSGNAIEETYGFAEMVIEKQKDLNPSVLYDLEKYHPKAWKIFSNHKRVDLYKCIKQNIERGIKEGIYRQNVNAEIVAKLYSEKLDMMFNIELFPRDSFSFEDIHSEMIRYHLKGIVSKEGVKYLKEKE